MMWRNSEDGYGLVAILFHWIGAFLVIGLLVLGYGMVRTSDMLLQFNLYQWHKSLGFLALILVTLRLVWRMANPKPRELPELLPLEHLAARSAHRALYLIQVLVPLAGWAVASVSPLAIPTFFFNLVVIPHLPMSASDEAETFWATVHASLAYAAAVLIAGHVAAALLHHFAARDDTLRRMVRPLVREKRAVMRRFR
ncbi:cytochrome b [Nitratireductor aestuarii]|nr:cytochrome b [Nitratireductor aestuarii]